MSTTYSTKKQVQKPENLGSPAIKSFNSLIVTPLLSREEKYAINSQSSSTAVLQVKLKLGV